MKSFKALEKEMEAAWDEDEEKAFELWTKMKRLDPWNDMFHLTCLHWPNCEDFGCMEKL